MKKITQIIFALVLFVSLASSVNASSNKILDYAKSTHIIAGDVVKLSNSDIVKIERFLNENEISENDQDRIIAKLESIVTILENAGTSDVTKLDEATKERILSIANEAAEIANLTITYDNIDKVLSIYQNGVVVDVVYANPYLKQTGNSNIVAIAVLVVLALTSGIVVKKVLNA